MTTESTMRAERKGFQTDDLCNRVLKQPVREVGQPVEEHDGGAQEDR